MLWNQNCFQFHWEINSNSLQKAQPNMRRNVWSTKYSFEFLQEMIYSELWMTQSTVKNIKFLPNKPQKYRWAVSMTNDTLCWKAWTHCLPETIPCEKMQCSGKLVGRLNGEMMYWGRKWRKEEDIHPHQPNDTEPPYFYLLIPDFFKIQPPVTKFFR